jgi:hypothetical protein
MGSMVTRSDMGAGGMGGMGNMSGIIDMEQQPGRGQCGRQPEHGRPGDMGLGESGGQGGMGDMDGQGCLTPPTRQFHSVYLLHPFTAFFTPML